MSAFVFVTSDNPRTENPSLIVLDRKLGIKRAGLTNFRAVVDRETAIKEAVMSAEKGDIILIAGKGHENYQIIGREKRHFDDKEIAEKYIELRRRKENLESKREKQQEFDFQ
jgi:UDP-N-acetylmuramoyl-L-alanyl-D-glutamate--2,6-diaminopimelate ligase